MKSAHRNIPLLALSTIALALLSVTIPRPASAGVGSYQIPVCNYAPGAVNRSWVWKTTDTSEPQHYTQHNNCPDTLGGTGGTHDQEGGLSTTDTLELHNGAPAGTYAGWTDTAPPGTTFTEITDESYIGHEIDPSNYWSPALRADGTILPGQTCLDTIANNDSCFIGGPPGQGGTPNTITGLSAHELSLGITCQAPQNEECITGAILHKAWAAMYGATITIKDPTPPTIEEPTGTLWEPGTANGYHHGTENVTTTAHDTGGGVQNITLTVDGQPQATYTAPCDYTHNQPCPTSTGPQTLTLPTSQLPDGTHMLSLAATDAAGNQSTVASRQILVDNNPPLAPTGLAATPTQAGDSTFTVTWADPSGLAVPIAAATYQLCPASGAGACSAPEAAPLGGPATVTVPGPGIWTFSVWLTNAAGNGSPANAARTTLIVPVQMGQGGNGTGSGKPASGSGDHGSPSRPVLRVAQALHGRQLAVRVTGPPTGTVYIGYTARYQGKLIASATKKTTLRKGQLRVTFNLSARAATQATIQVSIRLDHYPTLISTRRHRPATTAASADAS